MQDYDRQPEHYDHHDPPVPTDERKEAGEFHATTSAGKNTGKKVEFAPKQLPKQADSEHPKKDSSKMLDDLEAEIKKLEKKVGPAKEVPASIAQVDNYQVPFEAKVNSLQSELRELKQNIHI